MILNLLIVAAGSAIGGMLRYLAAVGGRAYPAPLPYWTLGVNLIGGFVIGAAAVTLTSSERTRLLVITGFCGGFTTFSAFSLETLELFREGAYAWAFVNILLNIILSILACWGGYALFSRS
ncbi:MAG: fluoride efflux transporter CrcB [Bacteroidetes bacterium]|nr:fluoride efflux transporter CrcB [Bacteroidota bacterium]